MGKYWRRVGLHAVRFFLRALTFVILLSGCIQRTSAAPVSILQVELARHGGDLAKALQAVESHFASVEAEDAEPDPETKPEPQPTKLVAPAVAQLPAPTGGTMTSTSVTSGGTSPSIPPATLSDTVELLLNLSGEPLTTSDWVFMPPRFLDGVFRPPRLVVSL